MTKKQKLQALIEDLVTVGIKHGIIMDKYTKPNGQTEYFLKLQFEDVEVNIEKVFPTINHGP